MLKTTVDKLEGNDIKLTVTVSADEVDAGIKAAYEEVGKKLRIPGFRKGKAPRPVIDNFVGRDYVLVNATETLVNTTYPRALDQEDLRTVDAPEMEELPTVLPGEEYTYEAEVELRPQLELTSLDPITVTVPGAEVTDADVDFQLDDLRERFGGVETVERPVQVADFALISFTGYIDGETYDGNVVDTYLYELNRGLMPKEFDDGLLGMKAGEEKRIEFVIPLSSANPEYVGKTAQFDVTLHEVKARALAALDDAFAGEMGFDTVEDMRKDLSQRLSAQKAFQHMQAKEKAAREELARRLPGDIPQKLIDDRASSLAQDYARRLEEQGVSLEDYASATGMTREEFESNIGRDAEAQVREDLALEALFRAKGLEITDADIDQEFAEMGTAAKEGAEATRKRWEDMGLMPVVREGVVHRKAVGWLMDNVEVVVEDRVHPGSDAADEGTKKTAKKRAPKKAAAKAEEAAEETPAEDAPANESDATEE